VCHVDRRFARHGVPVGREETVLRERLDRPQDALAVALDRREPGEWHASAQVLDGIIDVHETQEELAGGLARAVRRTRLVELFRTAGERAGQASNLLVGAQRERVPLAPVEDLGQRVLQER
jgi:hypothetical protein